MEKLLSAALDDVKHAVENLETVIKSGTTKPKEITLEQVRAVLAEKSKAGFSEKIRGLIKERGADKLTDIDPKHFESLILAAEAM